jgi:hypothetical protein
MYMCAMDIDYAYATTIFWLTFRTVLRVFILFYHFNLRFHVWYLRKELQDLVTVTEYLCDKSHGCVPFVIITICHFIIHDLSPSL